MRKINIQEYRLSPYDPNSQLPVCNNTGEIVTVHCTDIYGADACLITWIDEDNRKQFLSCHRDYLFNYKPLPVYWYNVYRNFSDQITVGAVYNSEIEAKRNISGGESLIYIETLSYIDKGITTKTQPSDTAN
jgi:hypothetical protein